MKKAETCARYNSVKNLVAWHHGGAVEWVTVP